MVNHHALGQPGGPGGVDDVGRAGHDQRAGSVSVGERPVAVAVEDSLGRWLIERQACGAVRQRGAHSTVRQRHHERGRGVAEHERGPLGGKGRIDRKVGGPDLEHGEDCHDHLGRARQRQRHHPFRPRAPGDQVTGQPVGPGVQLGEGQHGAAAHQCGLIWRAFHLRLEQLRERRGGHVALPPGPGRQHLLLLTRGHQLGPRQRPVRVGSHAGQQHQQMPGHPRHRCPVEQIRVVPERTREHTGVLGELGYHVAADGGQRQHEVLDGQAWHRRSVHGCVLQYDHCLEQRAAAGVAR